MLDAEEFANFACGGADAQAEIKSANATRPARAESAIFTFMFSPCCWMLVCRQHPSTLRCYPRRLDRTTPSYCRNAEPYLSIDATAAP